MDQILKTSTTSFIAPPLFHNLSTARFEKSNFSFPQNQEKPKSFLSLLTHHKNARFNNIFTSHAVSNSTISRDEELSTKVEEVDEKFDWYSQWYPVMPISELDKNRPHGKKVMGIDIVVWWDRNEKEWTVMADSCPHRMAPLSEGRIDPLGRLQCVYHGWCFGGDGDCNFIPQAPRDGPPVHTSKRACATVYPSLVQNEILWFWPNSDPSYKDIHLKKTPPYISIFDDPSYAKFTMVREVPYGYQYLIENFMDPAHINYAHYGIMELPEAPSSVKADREGGMPLDIGPPKLDLNGFTAKQGTAGEHKFIAPCVYLSPFRCLVEKLDGESKTAEEESSSKAETKKTSVGNSRLILTYLRNFDVWACKALPPWYTHLGGNKVIDSDLYLLYLQERKLKEMGANNWLKSCYVPTRADTLVVGYRRWLTKYAGGQVDWGTKFSDDLPPTPAREKLLDRYWTHTVQCSSCSSAYKNFNALELVLHAISIASIGIAAAANEGMKVAARYSLVCLALLCFLASRWLSKFIYKSFHYHDYDHAFQ